MHLIPSYFLLLAVDCQYLLHGQMQDWLFSDSAFSWLTAPLSLSVMSLFYRDYWNLRILPSKHKAFFLYFIDFYSICFDQDPPVPIYVMRRYSSIL